VVIMTSCFIHINQQGKKVLPFGTALVIVLVQVVTTERC